MQWIGNSGVGISVPLSGYGDHRVRVSGRIIPRDPAIRTVAFEDTVQCPMPAFTKFLTVPVGIFRLELAVRDLTTGNVATDVIGFEIK
jgi:hypothetical protein